jgi:hypothetical protein
MFTHPQLMRFRESVVAKIRRADWSLKLLGEFDDRIDPSGHHHLFKSV